ncbi:uncharacterized protein LOC119666956 [Teleopsis dalmanni]|uniref:uncharacterized protein LOC119666956 n=1 Tax=Teleopsis dalmanni TaxID=139649 RepID=UPI0018CE6050|nr:uncharacterized protein LOC119666956 [Teleopsis dalmanni]
METVSNFLPGVAFIVNQSFSRANSEVDIEKLTKTFTALNITVVDWSDRNCDDIRESLKKLQTDWVKYYAHFEYVVMAYLSHGSDDDIVRDPVKAFSIQNYLLKPLQTIKELNHKLKWLIIQSCRGVDDFQDVIIEGDEKEIEYFTKYTLKSYSTAEGGTSFRNSSGSIYIAKLCEELDKNAKDKGLLDILEDTSCAVRNYFSSLLSENMLIMSILNSDSESSDTEVYSKDENITHIQQTPTTNRNFTGDFYFKYGFVFNNNK